MPILHAIILLSLISLTFTTSAAAPVATALKPKRLVTKLLHRDTVFYNQNNSIEDRAQRTLNSSMARFIYLSEKSSQTHDTRAHLHPATSHHGIFYVSFSIGQPPVQQLAVVDSGSSITWVKCQPCEQCSGTIYDPSKSLTYAKLPCNSSFCSNDCSLFSNECTFRVEYVKGPESEGTIATDQFGFETSDEGNNFVNDAAFGCSHKYNSDDEDGQIPGVFGLGTGIPSLSIVKKFDSKFSYCIGNSNDPEYRYNMLILGEGAIIEGDSTPMSVIDGIYYISLEGISIGEKMLDIDPIIFKKKTNSDEDGVFIDSGSSFTWLAPRAFNALREQIENLSDGLLSRHLSSPEWFLCFSGDVRKDLHGFPAMAFHFSGGVDLVLDAESMFYQDSSSVFCFTVGPSDFFGERLKDVSMIGIMAQQNYNVGYNLVENQLYFQRIDCQLLTD